MSRITSNPFRPGAGHQPPFLAGREKETEEFSKLLDQEIILQNLVITGLRGIGKTVLLESFKPIAHDKKWLWAGTDCSESTSVSEEVMALRLLTDIALITSSIVISEENIQGIGFLPSNTKVTKHLNFDFLTEIYRITPGLVADKLKFTLSFVWEMIREHGINGMVFAYDEAQTLSDHREEQQYPLSLLLDVFQYLQKREIPFMLILTGLPTLQVRLIETRTYTERLFHVLILDRLSNEASKDAIVKPIEESSNQIEFDPRTVDLIVKQSGGYPYFIQFLCREIYDIFEQQFSKDERPIVPLDAILQKLDTDFFAGRWAKATDREKDLLTLIAKNGEPEFSIQKIVESSQAPDSKPFGKSQVSQMLTRLIEIGLIYKTRRGSYAFAVPLLESYILRKPTSLITP